ncbi:MULTISPECIES: AAA family ATPase [Pseudanabaena]|uniref:AAA family ATPase n=1 Tax=Pseudanabaena TaxID=1152 RepID=UPI00247A91E4|nr:MULTISPECIES: AAA family ATPase [Pseudanabaena]MEA5488622.1 AAA family ATPase [Pseudanabaena sp. CCNP1317]WGS70986.1 AAA family ATPase [Pseudanabaena galeata CCNP1313]
MFKLAGNLGLCGAHRTGKTTLAIAISSHLNIPFVRTTTSQVFAQLGLDPAEPMDFQTRLFVQNHVLDAAEQVWQNSATPFVSDRTPIDMIAYTLGDIQGKTEVDFDLLSQYIDRCFASTNQFFQNLAIIQPGIPLVYEEGKAALNAAYIEHINVLVIGLCNDSRLKTNVFCNARDAISIDLRINNILRTKS